MIISSAPFPPMTAAEYLDWEPQQEQRYEYINGEIVAMTGGTVPHNDIAINLLTALLPQVRASGCRINMADVKLCVNETGLYYYPDLLVSCHPQDLNARKFIQFPKLIVEVLSPGTADKDRTDKFTDYQGIPTLQEYLLISSEKISADVAVLSLQQRRLDRPGKHRDYSSDRATLHRHRLSSIPSSISPKRLSNICHSPEQLVRLIWKSPKLKSSIKLHRLIINRIHHHKSSHSTT
jgi:Uma2 family endonuclease